MTRKALYKYKTFTIYILPLRSNNGNRLVGDLFVNDILMPFEMLKTFGVSHKKVSLPI